MALDKQSMGKFATVIGYLVYAASTVFGIFLIFTDPTQLYTTKPSMIQLGGLLIICYGIVECAVTFYNRLPPLEVKTAEQVSVDKARLREINDRKSKEKKAQ